MMFQHNQWASKADRPWCHGIPPDSIKVFDIPWYSGTCSDRPQRLIFHTVPQYSWICNNILVYAASFQDRPRLRYSTIFLDIPRYSSICSDLPRQTMAPWYSMLFQEIARYSMIFQCAQWASKTYHDIRISPAILFLVDTADLCLVFVARAAQVPTPPAGDTEIFPM